MAMCPKGTYRVRVLPVGTPARLFKNWTVVETYPYFEEAELAMIRYAKEGRLKEGERLRMTRAKQVLIEPSVRTVYNWMTGYEMTTKRREEYRQKYGM